jgi:hypothetical protein
VIVGSLYRSSRGIEYLPMHTAALLRYPGIFNQRTQINRHTTWVSHGEWRESPPGNFTFNADDQLSTET